MHDQAARALTALAVLCLAAAVGVGGLGLLIAALYLLLAAVMPPAAAAAVSGLLALLLAAVLLLFCRGLVGSRPRGAARESPEKGAGDLGVLKEIGDSLTPIVRRHLPAAAATAFLAGLVLGISPRARGYLWRLIDRHL